MEALLFRREFELAPAVDAPERPGVGRVLAHVEIVPIPGPR